MQQVQLHLSHNNFYCPVTGRKISGDEGEAEGEKPSLRFLYLSDIDEFNSIQPDLETLADQVRADLAEKEEEFEDLFFDFFEAFKDALQKDKANENLVIYSITTSGMACGPTSGTIHIGIDMDFEITEEDN